MSSCPLHEEGVSGAGLDWALPTGLILPTASPSRGISLPTARPSSEPFAPRAERWSENARCHGSTIRAIR
jgi:hypothetical protein